MKKRLGNINVNISNKGFYSIILLSISILLIVGVFAFGTSTPNTFGHSAKELDLSQGVEGNAVFNGNVNVSGNVNAGSNICFGGSCINAWSQVNSSAPASSGGSYTGNLVNNIHTGANCVSTNGIPTEIQGNKFVCRFISSSCPSGWTAYQNWSTTNAAFCGGTTCVAGNFASGGDCFADGHVFSNKTKESCTPSAAVPGPDGGCTSAAGSPCYASIQEIGCY